MEFLLENHFSRGRELEIGTIGNGSKSTVESVVLKVKQPKLVELSQ